MTMLPSGGAAQTTRHLTFAACTAVICLLHMRLLTALFHYADTNVSASHILLVPAVSAYLAWQHRRAVARAARWSWAAAAAAGLPGLALLVAGGFYPSLAPAGASLSVPAAGLVLLLVAGFLLCYGPAAARVVRFPLLFLVFAVPIPQPLLDAFVQVLKRGTTEVVAILFAATGTTYHREAFTFALRDFTIVVADECSGIRSSIALVLTSLLMGHTMLTTTWRKAAIVAVVIPITIFKNAVRIVGLTLLATHVDPDFLTGQLHRDGGVAFFVLALAMLAPVLLWLRRSESAARRVQAAPPVPSEAA